MRISALITHAYVNDALAHKLQHAGFHLIKTFDRGAPILDRPRCLVAAATHAILFRRKLHVMPQTNTTKVPLSHITCTQLSQTQLGACVMSFRFVQLNTSVTPHQATATATTLVCHYKTLKSHQFASNTFNQNHSIFLSLEGQRLAGASAHVMQRPQCPQMPQRCPPPPPTHTLQYSRLFGWPTDKPCSRDVLY